MATTILSYNLTTLHHVKKGYQTHAFDPFSHITISTTTPKLPFLGTANLDSFRTINGQRFKRGLLAVQSTPEAAEGLFSFLPADTPWFAWVGAAMVAVPLGVQKLINLTNQVEAVAETVEGLADRVGNVAREVDKAADEMLEKLPEGKFRDFVDKIEDLAEATAKEAQRVEDLMDKVEEMSNDVEDMLVEATKKEKRADEALKNK